MARPTRQERLASAAEAAREKIAAEQRKLASLQAQQREEERKARDKRRFQVGTIADECGLLTLDDAVLRPLLGLLSTIASVPNPVALPEGILADVGAPPGRSVHGFAQASPDVATT